VNKAGRKDLVYWRVGSKAIMKKTKGGDRDRKRKKRRMEREEKLKLKRIVPY